jgi:hypothetical protein
LNIKPQNKNTIIAQSIHTQTLRYKATSFNQNATNIQNNNDITKIQMCPILNSDSFFIALSDFHCDFSSADELLSLAKNAIRQINTQFINANQ